MIINVRKSKALPDPIIINDYTVERVCAYKYLGVVLNYQTFYGRKTLITLYPNLIHAFIVRESIKILLLIFVLHSFFISWLSKESLQIAMLVGVETLRSRT